MYIIKINDKLMILFGILIISLITKSSYPQGAKMNMPENQQSNIIYVKHQSDSPDAWQDKSRVYTSIKSAIRAASDGDEIWVAKGYYRENIVLKQGIHLLGGFEGVESIVEQRGNMWNDITRTTIDAGNNGRCILAASNTVIDGFKLINGKDAWGAGLGISNSTNIQVRNIMIQSCQASWAGSGILVDSPGQDANIL